MGDCINNKATTTAIILAGGLGTRLREVVNDVPKPMAPVGGRPFLEYVIDYWIEQGITRVILSVGYLAEKIEDHFGSIYKGCEISYVRERSPLGTGGALKRVLMQNENNLTDTYTVFLNGDTWYEVDLEKMILDAKRLQKPVTVAVKPMQINDRYGALEIDPIGIVTEFGLNSSSDCYINGGCYLLDAVEISKLLQGLPNKFSLESDLLVPLAFSGDVASSIHSGKFLDIGVPKDFVIAAEILEGREQ